MSSFRRNLFSNLFGQFATLAITFVGVKFIFAQLGAEAFGIIYFSLTCSIFLSALLELGICTTLTKELAARSRATLTNSWPLIRSATAFYWSAYVIVALVWIAISPHLVRSWLSLAETTPERATLLLRVLGVGTLCAIPRSLYTAILRGKQRMDIANALDVSSVLCQQIGLLACLEIGMTVVGVVQWITITAGISVFAQIVCVARLYGLPSVLPRFSWNAFASNRSYMKHALSLSLLSFSNTQFDKLLLTHLVPVAVAGYYGFVYTVVRRGPVQFAAAVGQAVLPHLSQSFGQGDRDSLRRQFYLVNEVVSFGVVPLFAAVVYGIPHLLTLTFNAAVSRQMVPIGLILSAAFYGTTLMLVPLMFCLATNRADIPDLVNRKATLISVPCTLGLCATFGAVGAAVSVLIYQSLVVFFMTPVFCRECVNTPVGAWVKRLKPTWVAGIGCYMPALLLLHFQFEPSVRMSAFAFAVSSLAFWFWAVRLLSPGLRNSLTSQFGGWFGKCVES